MLNNNLLEAKLPILVSAFIFAVVGFVQLLRFFQQWPVVVDNYSVPLWASALAAMITWSMSGWLLYVAKTKR
jgi:hypothetical protein